jgi:addiction module HigA family antidote
LLADSFAMGAVPSGRTRGGESAAVPLSRAIERRLRASISRTPPHPGRFLETRFLKPAGITQSELASALHISRRRVNELIRGKRAITPDTAVRLSIYFGNDAIFWMQLQAAWDLNEAMRRLKRA